MEKETNGSRLTQIGCSKLDDWSGPFNVAITDRLGRSEEFTTYHLVAASLVRAPNVDGSDDSEGITYGAKVVFLSDDGAPMEDAEQPDMEKQAQTEALLSSLGHLFGNQLRSNLGLLEVAQISQRLARAFTAALLNSFLSTEE